MVDHMYHIVVFAQSYLAVLLISSSRNTPNPQSLESHNQNLTYGILQSALSQKKHGVLVHNVIMFVYLH